MNMDSLKFLSSTTSAQKMLCIGASIAAVGGLTAALWVRSLRLPPGPCIKEWGPMVFGHRGCRFVPGIPENTLASLTYAYKCGATGVEIDVRLSKDGKVVVMHDSYLDRMMLNAPEKAEVRHMTLAELKQLRYREDPTGALTIPTLEEVVHLCMEKKLKLQIEIKEISPSKELIEGVVEIYHKYPEYMYDQTVCISFNPLSLYALRKRDLKIAVGQIHCGDIGKAWACGTYEHANIIIRWTSGFWDVFMSFVSTNVAPYFLGVSMMLPKIVCFDESYKKYFGEKLGCLINIWGVPDAKMMTSLMKGEGISVSADDKYSEFAQAVM